MYVTAYQPLEGWILDFIKKFVQNAVELKDMKILCDDANPKGITYGQLDIMSGKVYSYLKNEGIGKEDFVMLCLPRGIQPLVALCGVIKAGAAFVIVEDNYAPERIKFIKNDCGCKAVIDSEVWEKIQYCDYLAGYEETDEHDAAFAVYTSGTTGNPKGVVHEYGNLDRMAKSVEMTSCPPLATNEDRFALVAPLNFVASMLITVYAFYYGVMCYVVAYSVIKNPLSIGMFFIKNKITGTFLTPSYIRRLKAKPPQLKFCIIGSEPANEVYLDGLTIHNFYLMSESGFAVTHFLIDKKYEFTPVGKSEFGHEILLLDEDGNPVPDGEEGEVCFENKYVRGYMNLPEETAKAFKDGIYHSGDLAKKNPDGNFVICGRLNDMVKINGNRVEPGEIENVAKKVLGVDWTAARIFDDGNQVYICVYYLKNLKIDFEKAREEMSKYLPYYMIPSYFIKVDEIPLRPNGKMDRKALPAPNIESYMNDYVEPTNDIEKALCDAFSKVLKIKRVGIKDDFYQLGGDSLASMDVLVESGIKGLTTADIFAGHTPEKIAAIYTKKHPDGVTETDEEREERAKKEPHLLTPFQAFMIDYQLYTPMSTMWNLGSLYRFDKNVLNIEKLAEAIKTAVDAHPALCTVFSFNEDGDMIQTYKPELSEPVRIEKLSEIEFTELKNGLVSPFKIMNSRLYRIKLFETEKNGYLFFDIHHTLFDGTSSKVLLQDIVKAYYDIPLEKDYYYLTLMEHEEALNSESYLEDKKYFEDKYDSKAHFSRRPRLDRNSRENTLGRIFGELKSNEEAMKKVENKYKITRNAFFSFVSMMSVAIYNKDPNVLISWTYNGRDDLKKLSTVGMLLRDLRLSAELTKKTLLTDLYADIQSQVMAGIEHSSYPYTMLGADVLKDDVLCFLYQENLRDNADGMDDFKIEEVEMRRNRSASENILDIELLDGRDGLELMIEYNASCYEAESMEKFRDIFIAVTEALLSLSDNDGATVIDAIKLVNKKIKERMFFINWIK